jgi:hypothetical protein
MLNLKSTQIGPLSLRERAGERAASFNLAHQL